MDERFATPRQDLSEEVMRTLRKIIRAIDLHSKKLVSNYGLTGSQAMVMRELTRAGEPLPVSALAARISLSHATVTDILNRLARKDLVARNRDDKDKRRILVSISAAGRDLIDGVPSLLQDEFLRQFHGLEDWEQTNILSTLQRVATLMNAQGLDAAPLLASGTIGVSDSEL